jgi:ubiquinone/menaquinone biosynthesis C-methylase UbiE
LFQEFIARQLAHPKGWFGRFCIARWLNKANLAMNEFALEQLSTSSEDRILEIGFGGGDLLEKILSTKSSEFVAGVDLSIDMVNVVGHRLRHYIQSGRAEVRSGDIEALPYANGEFTKVCSINTLYFWRNPSVALAECHRVLRPGGEILLCFNSREDLEAWPSHKYGFRLYDLVEVEKLLKSSGFTTIKVASAHDSKQGLFYCVSALSAK